MEKEDELKNKKAIEKREKKARWLSDISTLESGFLKIPRDENGLYHYIREEDCKIANVLVENADKWVEEKNRKLKKEQNKEEGQTTRAFKIFSKKTQGEIFNQIQPIFYDRSGLFWLWNKTKYCWELSDEVDLLNIIEQSTGADIISSTERAEIINTLKQEGRKRLPKPIKNTWIQFKDEIIDITNGERFKAIPEFFATNPIPHKINGNPETPIMDKIFEEWVGKEYVKTLYEIIAYCCICDYPINRLFCFVGAGMNGKSCFLTLLRRFIGITNVCSTELDFLLTSRFEITKLHKKLVCMMGETNFNEIKNTSILKRLTGGDLIGFEYKNKNPFEDKNYAKIIIATNNLPSTDDKTVGFYRRWMIIDFPNQFTEKKDILCEIPEEEYNNLATKSIWILTDLLKNREFTNEGTIEQRMKKFEEKSNFLSKFIDISTEEDANGFILVSDFNKKFASWCRENKHREMSDTSIGLNLKKMGIEQSTKSFEWLNDGRGGTARVWLGFKWKL